MEGGPQEIWDPEELRFSPLISSLTSDKKYGRSLSQTHSITIISNGPQVLVKQARGLKIS